MKVFSLLYVADVVDSVNMVVDSSDEKILVYLKNALLLSSSLRSMGLEFCLITNDANYLSKLLSDLPLNGCPIDIVEIPFDLAVPKDIGFYSAHFKIDVFRYFSRFSDDWVCLVDLDVVALSSIDGVLPKLINDRKCCVYDISDTVIQEYGSVLVEKDLKAINPELTLLRWYGGEFIGGTGKFFGDLYLQVLQVFPLYTRIYKNLHHNGDEILVSAVIPNMQKLGYEINDIGTLCIVSRYWSGVPRYVQRDFSYAKKSAFLHLPQDKIFLSDYFLRFPGDFCSSDFMSSYFRYLIKRKIRNLAVLAYRLFVGRL